MHQRVYAYLNEIEPACAANTHRMYARHLSELADWHGRQHPPPPVCPASFQRFIDDPSTRTGAQRCAAIRGFLRWLPEFSGDPEQLRPPRAPGKAAPDLDEGEIEAVLVAIDPDDPREQALVRVLLQCGLQSSEATGLAWSDVDPRWLHAGRGERARRVPLPGLAASALERLSVDRVGDAVFADSAGRPISTRSLHSIVARVGRRAGIGDLNPRALRRACLHRHRRAGRTHEQIMGRMGFQNTLAVGIALGEMSAELTTCGACQGRPDLRPAASRCAVCRGTGVIVEPPPAYVARVRERVALVRLAGRARELVEIAQAEGLERSWVRELREAAVAVETAHDEALGFMQVEVVERSNAPLPEHEDIVPRLRAVATELRKLARVFVLRTWALEEWGRGVENTGCAVDLIAARVEATLGAAKP